MGDDGTDFDGTHAHVRSVGYVFVLAGTHMSSLVLFTALELLRRWWRSRPSLPRLQLFVEVRAASVETSAGKAHEVVAAIKRI